MMVDEKRALKCPVDGKVLGEVSPDATGCFWRRCHDCRALVRFDLTTGRFAIEEPPRRR